MILDKLRQLYEKSGLCNKTTRFHNYTLACVMMYHGIGSVCLFDTGGETDFGKIYPLIPRAERVIVDFIFGRNYSYDFFLVSTDDIYFDTVEQKLRITILGQINKVYRKAEDNYGVPITEWIYIRNQITVFVGQQSKFYLVKLCN